MRTSNKIYRIHFCIKDMYLEKNIANTISETPFWYCRTDFRTLDQNKATEFDNEFNALRSMIDHANSEPMLNLMLEFYEYNIEMRRLTCKAWAPKHVYYTVNTLVDL